MSKEELVQRAIKVVLDGDEEAAVVLADRVIAEGVNPVEIINEGFTPGMTQVGDLFGREEIALPEVLLAAEAMQRAVERLEPHIPQQEVTRNLGTVVIGTVQGDIHDIGKGIVATMLRVYGFEVHDLGRDVPIDAFVEKAREVGADIVASSSLMTTTMAGQRLLEDALKEAGLRDRVKTMVGGAAVTHGWAEEIGADGYAEDVTEAVVKAKNLVTGGGGSAP